MSDRKVVIPGEIIVKGEKYLPGEGTEKRGENIVAERYGLSEESNGLVRVIPLTGVYIPRRGNVVIGKIENINMAGWFVNIGTPDNAFLPLAEFPRFINKNEIEEAMAMGEMVVAKIREVNKRGVDLTIKSRGLGRVEEGLIIAVNPNKVPRIIGKEGSMVGLIKEETGCDLTVGQNGLILINGDNVESELFAKRAVEFITERSFVDGLTEEIKEWFKKQKK